MVEEQIEKVIQREVESLIKQQKDQASVQTSFTQPPVSVKTSFVQAAVTNTAKTSFVQGPVAVAAKKETRYEDLDDIQIVDDWDYEDDF